MVDRLDEILDACIDRINRGDRIEDCLADYSEYADELEPLLRSMLSTRDAYSFTPQVIAKQAARQRFSAVLRESGRKQEKSRLSFPWMFGKARAWAVIAMAAVVVLAGYFAITQLLPPGVTVYEPDPQGNFAFYISDAPNAIGDFQSLELTISKVTFEKESGDWVEFEPETEQVDLTQLQGDRAQEIWRGNLPEGQYTEAVLYISRTSGVLKNNSHTMDVQPIGNKLHLVMNFEISAESVTEFVYDVTVVDSGSGRYKLQPGVEESGTGKQIQKVKTQGQGEGPGPGQDQGQMQGSGQGN